MSRHCPIPEGAVPYRQIGPFDSESLPRGLLMSHNLAEGVWGELQLAEGSLDFVWEDGSHDVETLLAPASLVIPPKIRHHLENATNVSFTISFHREEG